MQAKRLRSLYSTPSVSGGCLLSQPPVEQFLVMMASCAEYSSKAGADEGQNNSGMTNMKSLMYHLVSIKNKNSQHNSIIADIKLCDKLNI